MKDVIQTQVTTITTKPNEEKLLLALLWTVEFVDPYHSSFYAIMNGLLVLGQHNILLL